MLFGAWPLTGIKFKDMSIRWQAGALLNFKAEVRWKDQVVVTFKSARLPDQSTFPSVPGRKCCVFRMDNHIAALRL